MSDPVGYYCDHSDEPMGERTHHEWDLVDYEGWVFQHKPETISAHAGLQEYLTAERQKQRCPRAVAVYTADVVEQARRIAVELENENAQLTARIAELEANAWTPDMQDRYRKRALQWGAAEVLVERARDKDIDQIDTDVIADALGLNEEDA